MSSTALKSPQKLSEMPLVLIRNMVSLATSGFGVVVALAWNEVIQNAVKTYIDPYLGKNSGMVSLLIYAIVITILAVVVTMQLTSLEKQLTFFNRAVAERAKQFSRSTPTTKKNLNSRSSKSAKK
jgi:uncharacterized membrane protein (DUF106 family)